MKGNRFTDTVREYTRKLNDDDLRYLHLRLTQRVAGDVGEALELIQRHSDMDHWLSHAKSSNELFDMIDVVDASVQNEAKRRFALYEQKEKVRN